MENKPRVVVKCPVCEWRILDKLTPTAGKIEIKCPNCRHVVKINLALRTVTRCRAVGILERIGSR